MSTHPYVPLYVDDYDAATAHLTVEEDGAYGRLIRLCWRTPGCSLPADEAWIARKIRMTADEFARVAKPVLDEFFTLARGRFVQKRLKREYDDISRKKTARKLAGKKGGEAKARKEQDNPSSIATVLPGDTGAFPNPEPEPEEETPIAPKGADEPALPKVVLRQADVEAVWSITPARARQRTGKADILKALQGAARRGHQPADVITGLRAYYASAEATKDGGEFAKGAHRMITADRWQGFAETPTPLEALAAAPDPLAEWRRRVDRFKNGSGFWNSTDWEAQPGRAGCIVPPSILREFGYEPARQHEGQPA